MDECMAINSQVCCLAPPGYLEVAVRLSPRGEATQEGVGVNNTYSSTMNPGYNMMILNYQYSVNWKQTKAWLDSESNCSPHCHVTR